MELPFVLTVGGFFCILLKKAEWVQFFIVLVIKVKGLYRTFKIIVKYL